MDSGNPVDAREALAEVAYDCVWGERHVGYAIELIDALLAHPDEVIRALTETGALERVAWYGVDLDSDDYVYVDAGTKIDKHDEPLYRLVPGVPVEPETPEGE